MSTPLPVKGADSSMPVISAQYKDTTDAVQPGFQQKDSLGTASTTKAESKSCFAVIVDWIASIFKAIAKWFCLASTQQSKGSVSASTHNSSQTTVSDKPLPVPIPDDKSSLTTYPIDLKEEQSEHDQVRDILVQLSKLAKGATRIAVYNELSQFQWSEGITWQEHFNDIMFSLVRDNKQKWPIINSFQDDLLKEALPGSITSSKSGSGMTDFFQDIWIPRMIQTVCQKLLHEEFSPVVLPSPTEENRQALQNFKIAHPCAHAGYYLQRFELLTPPLRNMLLQYMATSHKI